MIKSRTLLPIEHAAGGNEAAEDPRKSLIERLLQYEQVKQAAQMLADRQKAESATLSQYDADTFSDAAMRHEALSAQPADVAADLSSVFRQILERATNRPTLTITNDAVMVRQMVDYLIISATGSKSKMPRSLSKRLLAGPVHRGSSPRPCSLCSRGSDSGRCS